MGSTFKKRLNLFIYLLSPSYIRYGIKGKASKAFLTQDKSGATFLCYLLGELNKLRYRSLIHGFVYLNGTDKDN